MRKEVSGGEGMETQMRHRGKERNRSGKCRGRVGEIRDRERDRRRE